MKEKLIATVGKQITNFPRIKKMLISFIDFFLEYKMVLVGNLTRNPAYLRHVFTSKVLAKPGTLSFGAIFNPGVLWADDHVVLLAKAQKIPWFETGGAKRHLYLQGSPVVLLLDKNTLEVVAQNVVPSVLGFPQEFDWAIEDTRLFYWKGKKMVNHSLVVKGEIQGHLNQTGVRSAVSVFDDKEKSLRFCALPHLDFPLQNFEKNWVYKESNSNLYLFYSLNPYKVLILENEKTFTFKTLLDQQFDWKLKNPGNLKTMVSFSTNPIDFNEENFLIVVHQIDNKISGRCYFHWAVLIDKKSLLPVKISSKPIFSGMGARGRTPGIRYISSILKTENEILFFAGEGDVCVTVTKMKISEIESLFVNLH